MGNSNDVKCILNLEMKINSKWIFHSTRRKIGLPWDFVKNENNGLPDDISSICHNRHHIDYINFAVFGEETISQDRLIDADFNADYFLKIYHADEIRIVVWYTSWKDDYSSKDDESYDSSIWDFMRKTSMDEIKLKGLLIYVQK